jgi:acylphosphatase
MKTRAHVYISGRVQGVFFRACTRDEAKRLDLTGWVRNTADGRVEAVFEGEESAVDAMVSWCHKGSPYSMVEDVEVRREEYRGGFSDFGVRY